MTKRRKSQNSGSLVENIRNRSPQLEQELLQEIEQFRQQLATCNPAKILTRLAERYYRERLDGADPSLLIVEYVTWLYLLQDEYSFVLTSDEKISEILNAAEELELSTFALQTSRSIISDEKTDLIQHAKSVGLWVRSPGFHHKERSDLVKLFAPLEGVIQQLIGFNASDAVAFEKAILQHVAAKTMPAALREETFQDDSFTISAHELAVIASRSPSSASAFLDYFSLDRGQQHPGKDLLPTRVDKLELAPLLRLPHGRYLCHLISKLIWAIRPGIEKCLESQWHSYDSVRARYLEEETAKALELMGGDCWRGLKYRMKSNLGIQHELDVLWHCESVSILAECKAGKFSLASLRGAPKGIQTDLRELISKADEQLCRAKEQLIDRDSGGFNAATGIVHPCSRKILTLAVTLEAVPFTTKEDLLAREGYLSASERVFIISLHDLQCIIEVLKTPSLVIDYICRRVKLQSFSIATADELDLLGIYLRNQLHFTSGYDGIALGTFSHDIDHYFESNSIGHPTPVPLPAFAPIVNDLVRTLERRKCDNYLSGALFLLEGASHFDEKIRKGEGLYTQDDYSATYRITTNDYCLVLVIFSGRINNESLRAATESASQEMPSKSVLGIGRSKKLPDGIRTHLPFNTASNSPV